MVQNPFDYLKGKFSIFKKILRNSSKIPHKISQKTYKIQSLNCIVGKDWQVIEDLIFNEKVKKQNAQECVHNHVKRPKKLS